MTDAEKIIAVLFIEDIGSEQQSILQALSLRGSITDLNIATANTLGEGLEKLQERAFDVVLLDLDLPDCKSLKSVSTILHQFPDMAIVVLSGHSEEGIVTEALLMGAQEFLIKGECSGAMIKHTIRQAFTRKSILKQKEDNWKRTA